MTMTDEESYEAMLAHHRLLSDQVATRVAALSGAVAAEKSYGVARADLVTYLANEVLTHAQAEEHTIYQAAASRVDLTPVVERMIREHRQLALDIEELAASSNARDAARRGEAIALFFVSHVTTENDVLLPALLADAKVDLAQLLAQMHRLTGVSHEVDATGELSLASDHEAKVLAQLLLGAAELARAGRGDTACTLVAATWATLRVPRPDLANQVNVALHRLVRLMSSESVTSRSSIDDGADQVLDVRMLAPAQRHATIFELYSALAAGAAFVLVNDHDPLPLRYQFEEEHAGAFTWDVVESGPKVWRVRVGRTGPRGGTANQRSYAQGH